MSIVVCQLPKAGLGNQLFPLFNALIFSRLNQLPLIIVGYHHLKIGPYLRKEKSKRKYSGYFTFQKTIVGESIDRIRIYFASRKLETIKEQPVVQLPAEALKGRLFLFEKLPTYHDYFKHLKPHRDEVKNLLKTVFNERILKQAFERERPVLGVHIRMGDFRKLKEGEDFSKVGHVRTPEDYFIDVIRKVREMAASDLPVSLFTDGYRHEFEKMFSLKNIEMVEGNADAVDLLLLSRSKAIVMANGSTFSYWAGFLSEAPIIKHPDHLYAPFRPNDINHAYYEGPLYLNNPDALLQKNLQSITE